MTEKEKVWDKRKHRNETGEAECFTLHTPCLQEGSFTCTSRCWHGKGKECWEENKPWLKNWLEISVTRQHCLVKPDEPCCSESECAARCCSTRPEPCVCDEWDGQYKFCLCFWLPPITSFNQPYASGFTRNYGEFYFRFKIQMCARMHTPTHIICFGHVTNWQDEETKCWAHKEERFTWG